MLKKILIALVLILVVLVVVVQVQPANYEVVRTETFNAPASAVFEQINELKNWEKWSEWHKMDPESKITYSSPSTSGVDAWYQWNGPKAGEGKLTILEAKPGEVIKAKLEFIKPMAGLADDEWKFSTKGDQTTVVWTMRGNHNFVGKAFALCMNMNDYIGKKHADGMKNIKAIVEPPTPTEAKNDPKVDPKVDAKDAKTDAKVDSK